MGLLFTGGRGSILLARYNSSGQLDTTFNPLGAMPGLVNTVLGSSNSGYGIVIQSDGKIVISGSINSGQNLFLVARYLANTTLIQSLLTIAIKNKYCGNGA